VALRALDVRSASYHAIGGFTVYDPELGWRLAPGREVVFRGAHFTATVRHNAEGLRDRHYAYERTPGRRRILVLGDSFVWCWGVALEDCFTERLEAALPDTDVINTGVPAWSTAQEMLFYEREGRRYRPDLVLLVFVPNDPVENLNGPGPRFRLVDGALVPPAAPAPRRKGAVQEWLQAHSRLYAEVAYRVTVLQQSVGYAMERGRRALAHAPRARPAAVPRADGEAFVPAAPPVASPAWPLTEALLDRLAADVRADGARFAVVTEAMPKRMTDWLRGVLAARGIPALELGPILREAEMRGERVRLAGDPHVAPRGQEIVAAAVAAFLLRDPGDHPSAEAVLH
jgi:hypothetical protein